MRVCARCGAQFPADARFCPEDGVQLFSSTDDPYVGQVFLKQFEVREICGRGSMGTVYRAWQTSMEREVAVKVLRKDLLRDDRVVKRFHREARASARLSHPNIIIVYMVGDTDDGVPFLVMEYVKGVSLDETCRQSGPIPTVRVLHIAKQIAAALAEAHSQSIVHRDLKPENILLSSKKHTPDFVKVLDFGIAKILYAEDENLTQTGAIFGTPHYLAPEQASGGEIDHRCDLYALGVILFRMTTGRLPFQSASGMEVLIQHIKQAPPRPREILESVPRPLEALILKTLEKDPDRRFQSAEDLGEALNQVVTQLRSGVLPMVSPGAPRHGGGDPPVPATLRPPIDVGSGEHHFSETQMGASGPVTPGPEMPTITDGEPPPREVSTPEAAAREASVPEDPDATGGDPRFHVPRDDELDRPPAAVIRTTERSTVPQRSERATVPQRSEQATVPQRPLTSAAGTIDPDVRRGGGETIGLSDNLMGRRRILLHVVLALVSIIGGGAVGALLYFAETASAQGDPPPPPPDTEAALTPVEPVPALEPDAVAPAAAPSPAPKPVKKGRKGGRKKAAKKATKKAPRKAKRKKPAKKKAAKKVARPKVPPVGPTPTIDHGGAEPDGHGHPPAKQPKPASNDDLYDLVE